MRRLRFRPEVADDRRSAWYKERQPGLGDNLLEVLDGVCERILDNPDLYPRVWADVHRCPLDCFPYSVFYLPEGDEVLTILAVHHQSRKPSGGVGSGMGSRTLGPIIAAHPTAEVSATRTFRCLEFSRLTSRPHHSE